MWRWRAGIIELAACMNPALLPGLSAHAQLEASQDASAASLVCLLGCAVALASYRWRCFKDAHPQQALKLSAAAKSAAAGLPEQAVERLARVDAQWLKSEATQHGSSRTGGAQSDGAEASSSNVWYDRPGFEAVKAQVLTQYGLLSARYAFFCVASAALVALVALV